MSILNEIIENVSKHKSTTEVWPVLRMYFTGENPLDGIKSWADENNMTAEPTDISDRGFNEKGQRTFKFKSVYFRSKE